MKQLESFVTEARRTQAEVDKMPTNLNQLKGEEAENNGTKGLYAVEPPSADLFNKPIPMDKATKNMKKLAIKFAAEEDFFVQGRAGWGKTAIITSMAHRYGYTVLTVYLDKAVASDLGGIPVPVKDKESGRAVQEMAMPAWANVMLKNPKTKFLLFFDEMNQAAPDVQNALMPIVLKKIIAGHQFENFFVGAAGNFEEENSGGITALSVPLKSRFKPIIKWEDGDWEAAFDFLTEKWKDKLPEDFMDLFKNNATLWVNPREVEMKIFQTTYKLKQMNEKNPTMGHSWDADAIYDRLLGLSYADGNEEELKQSDKDTLLALADKVFEYVEGSGDSKMDDDTRHFSGDLSGLTKQQITKLTNGVKNGYIKHGSNTYGVSRENIKEYDFSDDGIMNGEMWEGLFDKWEAEGVEFKYEKDSEWQKEHKDWLNP